jgi:hypothetical protein
MKSSQATPALDPVAKNPPWQRWFLGGAIVLQAAWILLLAAMLTRR